MEYIFVCYAGVNRSPIAVNISENLARKYDINNFNATSCGIAGLFSINPDSVRKRLNTADIIFALDQEVVSELIKNKISSKKIYNLEIEDIYLIKEYPQLREELERILTEKLEPFFIR